MGKAYCPQCGWNRGEAEKQTRLFLRLLPVFVILFDAPLIIWIFIGHAEVPVLAVLGVVAIIPAILVVLAVKGKARMEASRTPATRPGQTLATATLQDRTTSTAAPSGEVPEQYKVLAELQRPRLVRMSRQGILNVTATALALLVFAGALIAMTMLRPAASGGNIAPPSRSLVTVLPVALIAVIAVVMMRSLTQQRQLLTVGEIGLARVTKQWSARNSNGIRYEFTTPAGEKFSRMTTDSSRRLAEGMSVPIFYDRQQTKKQVALCAAFFEVVLPGGK